MINEQEMQQRWIARRDANAFTELIQRHSGMVYATCRRVLGDSTEAEDVAQECFMELAGATKVVKPSLGGWLHRVAVFRSLNRIRTEHRRKTRENVFAEAHPVANKAVWDDIKPHLDEAIAELPEKLRLAIIARFLEGKSQADVAKVLGVSRSTAQYRIERGVDEIRAFLKSRGITAAATALVAFLETRTAEAAPATLTITLGQWALAAYPNAAVIQPGLFGLTFLTWKMAGGISLLATLASIAAISSPKLSGSSETSESTRPAGVREIRSAASLEALQVAYADAATVESVAAGNVPSVPASASTDSHIIKGRVYIAGSEQGLREFGVYARPKGAVPDPGMKPDAITDDEGNFQITLPSGGNYEIQTQDTEASYCWMRKGGPLQSRTYYLDGQRSVDLRSDETKADISIEAGQLLAGKVLFPDGTPAAGVHVWARGESEVTKYWAQRETNAAGQFLFLGLEPGHEIQLYAASDEYASPVMGPIRIENSPSPELSIKLSGAAAIEGVVVDSAGHPAPFACAWLRPLDTTIIHPRFLTCDANGRFEVKGLLPASYEVILAPLREKPLKEDASVTEFHWGTIERSFPEAEPAERLNLSAGQRRDGLRIRYPGTGAGISGRITDEAGLPLSGIKVSLMVIGSAQTLTDEKGRYALSAVPTETYTVSATHEDYRSKQRSKVSSDMHDVNFVMEKRGVVEGRVIDARTGKPIIAFTLLTGRDRPYSNDMDQWFKEHSDPDGHFTYKPNSLSRVRRVTR